MERKPELDLGRVLAMLAVVAIHVSSGYIYAESAFSPGGMNPAFVLNQAGRFCVPLFILLSGASLGLRSGKEAPLRFWLSRLKKLGVFTARIWRTSCPPCHSIRSASQSNS